MLPILLFHLKLAFNMKTFLFICTCSGLLAFSGIACAQGSEEISTGQLLMQTGTLSTDGPTVSESRVADANQATLFQQGNLNQGTIDQNLLSAGRGNAAAISQNGNNNAAAALQTGYYNRTLITQVGNRNVVVSDIQGNNTESVISQDGNRNRVDQEIKRDNQRYLVEQMGNNNHLIQRETSGSHPGYEVEMRGNGIQIMIEQGRVSRLP
jgi:minor curlin subunit